jgi:predicted HTH domain antitoxin
MVHIAFDLQEGALASVRQDPATFTHELRVAAAVKWYELGRISQGRAAEIAGLSRAEFIDALGGYGASPFQETLEEVVAGIEGPGGDQGRGGRGVSL